MRRLDENPLITPTHVKPSRPDFEVVGTFNAAVTRLNDEVLLLVRVAERPIERPPGALVAPIFNPETGRIELFTVPGDHPDLTEKDERWFYYRGQLMLTSISHLRLARSTDGVHFTVEERPALFPERRTETYGLEDPRITRIGDDFWITYKAVSDLGITTALAHTTDFHTFTRHGILFCPENLDVVIFPEKFGRNFAAWTRPVGKHLGLPTIWSAVSPDLLHWGGHEPVLLPRPGMWDSARVGASAVPFRCSQGWLEIYHGADAHNHYCLGAALIDPHDPTRVLARSAEPLMVPEATYEIEGFFGGVVFSCGADLTPDGRLVIYYGAADECTCAVETSVDEILNSLQ